MGRVRRYKKTKSVDPFAKGGSSYGKDIFDDEKYNDFNPESDEEVGLEDDDTFQRAEKVSFTN